MALNPEMSFFGILLSSGMFLRHINGLDIINFKIMYQSADQRAMIVANDIKNAYFKGLDILGISKINNLIDVSKSNIVKFKKVQHDGSVKHVLKTDNACKKVALR